MKSAQQLKQILARSPGPHPLVAVPVVIVLGCILMGGLLRGCDADRVFHVALVAHEAPLRSELLLGSGNGVDLRLTEARIAPVHGMLEAGPTPDAWSYRHLAEVADAELLRPDTLGWHREKGEPPRFALTPSSLILTGVPSTLAVGPELCENPPAGVGRYQVTPVDGARIRLEGGDELLGSWILPLHDGTRINIGRAVLTVRQDEVWIERGAAAARLALPPPGLRFGPIRVRVPDATGTILTAMRTDRLWLSERLDGRFVAVTAPGSAALVADTPDRAGPPGLPPTGPGAGRDASIIRLGLRRPIEVVAHPSPGTQIVHCHTPQGLGERLLAGGARWVVSAHGSGTLHEDGFLVIGRSNRFGFSRLTRPWGTNGAPVDAIRVQATERIERVQLLSSLATGRLYHQGWKAHIPACREGLTGEPVQYLVIQASPPPAAASVASAPVPAAYALSPRPPVPIDTLGSDFDGAEPDARSVELPLPRWAYARDPQLEAGAPLLYLCRSTFGTVMSRLPGAVSPGGPLDPFNPERTVPGPTPPASWRSHAWGDQLVIGGQVLELRDRLPAYELWVPLLLLCLMGLVAGWRTEVRLHQLGMLEHRPGGAFRGEASNVIGLARLLFALVFLLALVGCALIARMCANPFLLGMDDYLQRTWIAAGVALFIFPTVLAYHGRWHDRQSLRQPVIDEMAIGLRMLAVAAIVDAAAWRLLPGQRPEPAAPAQRRILLAIVVLVALSALMPRSGTLLERISAAASIRFPRATAATRRLPASLTDLFHRLRHALPAWLGIDPVPARTLRPGLDPWLKALEVTADADRLEADAHHRSPSPFQARAKPASGAADPSGAPGENADGSTPMRRTARRLFWRHPLVQPYAGPGGRDLGLVLIAPIYLTFSTVVAFARGGASHNNIVLPVIGLGFKPAEIAALVLGMALSKLMVHRWDPLEGRSGPDAPIPLPPHAPWRTRLRRWVDPEGWLDDDPPRPARQTLLLSFAAGPVLLMTALWSLGLVPAVVPALAPLVSAPVALLAFPRWMRLAAMVCLVRYCHLVIVLPALLAALAAGLLSAVSFAAAACSMLVWEIAVRRLPELAPLLVMSTLMLGVTLIAFGLQGDFGPLMVTTPAVLLLVMYWALSRLKAGRSRRVLVPLVLMAATLSGLIAVVGLFMRWRHLSADIARAAERFVIWQKPWYATHGEWAVQARWIAADLQPRESWVANLHSDLAWLAVRQTFTLPAAVLVLMAFGAMAIALLELAEGALARATREGISSATTAHRDLLRRSAFLCAFTAFYLLCEVWVHQGTCLNLLPPTGLTLPWISNGGTAAFTYALLVSVALGQTLWARRASTVFQRKLEQQGWRTHSAPCRAPVQEVERCGEKTKKRAAE